MSVLDLVRPDIRALEPYSSARMEASGGEVLLNANESPWPPCGDDGLHLNRYPDPQPHALVERLAALYGVDPPRLLVGRGSDEAIDLLVRAFCRSGVDAVVVCPPTFGMYAVAARVQGAAVVEISQAPDFILDAETLLAQITSAVKLVFLCSPNNPTGSLVALAAIERIAAVLRDRALVVVDEAYLEFAGARSATTLLGRHDNLAVLRTLSKAWALAGARIGVALAHPDVIALLRRIMPPYPLPKPSVMAVLTALMPEGEALMHARVALTVAERKRVAAALVDLPGVRAVLPSRANFLCVRFDDAVKTYRGLRERGIVVRDVGRHPALAGCLRIGIGTPAENSRLLAALDASQVSA